MNDTEIIGFLSGMAFMASVYAAWYAGLFAYTKTKTKKMLNDAQFAYEFGKYGEAYIPAHQIANNDLPGFLSLFSAKKPKQKAASLVQQIESELIPKITEEICRAVRVPQDQVEMGIHLKSGTCYIEDPNNPENSEYPFNDSLRLKEISPTYNRYFETAG